MGIVITQAVVRTGLELCDEVDRLAPLTRSKRIKAVDLTSSTLAVKAERLRAALERLAVAEDDLSSLQRRLEDATATAASIVEMTREWVRRSEPTGEREELARTVLERGDLLVTFLRKEAYGVLPRETS